MADTKKLDIHSQLAGVEDSKNENKLELADLRGASELLRHKAIQDLRTMREELYTKLLKDPKKKDLLDRKERLASFVKELLGLKTEYEAQKSIIESNTSAVTGTLGELFREAQNTDKRLTELNNDMNKSGLTRWFKRISVYDKDEERINQDSFDNLLTKNSATELIAGLRDCKNIDSKKRYLESKGYSAKRIFDDKELQALETFIELAAFGVSSRKNEKKHEEKDIKKMDTSKISSVLDFLADFDGDGRLEIKNKGVFTDYQGQFLSEAQMRETLGSIKDFDSLKKVFVALGIKNIDMKDEKQAKNLRAEFLKAVKLRYDMGASIESIFSGDISNINNSVSEYQAIEKKSWEKTDKKVQDKILTEIGNRLDKQNPKAKKMFDEYKSKNPQGTKEMFLEKVRKDVLEGLYISGGYNGLNAAISLNVSEMTDGVIDHVLITTLGPAISKDFVNTQRHKLTVIGSLGGGVDYTYQASRGLTLGFSAAAGKVNGTWKSVAGVRAMYETYNGSDRRIYDILDATNQVVDKYVSNTNANKNLDTLLSEVQKEISKKTVKNNLEKSEFSVENLSTAEKAELQKALDFFKSLPVDNREAAKTALLQHMEMSLRDERNGWHLGSIGVAAGVNLKTGSILVAPLVTFVRFYTKHEKLDTTRLGTGVSRVSEAEGFTLDAKVNAAIDGVKGQKLKLKVGAQGFENDSAPNAKEYLYIPGMKISQVSAPKGVIVMEYNGGLLFGGKLYDDKNGLSLVKKTLSLSGGTQEIFVIGDLDKNTRGQSVRRLDFTITKTLTNMKSAEFVSGSALANEITSKKPIDAKKGGETEIKFGEAMDKRITNYAELNKTFSETISRRTLNTFKFLRDFSVDVDNAALGKDLKDVDAVYINLMNLFKDGSKLSKYVDQKENGGTKKLQEALEANKNATADVKLYILRMFQSNFNKDINTENQLNLKDQKDYDARLKKCVNRKSALEKKGKDRTKSENDELEEVKFRIRDMKRTLDKLDASRDKAFSKIMRGAVKNLQGTDESNEDFALKTEEMMKEIDKKKSILSNKVLKNAYWTKSAEEVNPKYMMFEIDSKVDLNDDKKGYHLMRDSRGNSLAGLKAKPGVIRYAAKNGQEGLENNSVDINNDLHKKLLLSRLPDYVFEDIAKALTLQAMNHCEDEEIMITTEEVKELYSTKNTSIQRGDPKGKHIDFGGYAITRIFKSADCINDAYLLELGLRGTPYTPGEKPTTTDFPIKFGAGHVTVGNKQEQVKHEIGATYVERVNSGGTSEGNAGTNLGGGTGGGSGTGGDGTGGTSGGGH